jgi:hypothetical protein
MDTVFAIFGYTAGCPIRGEKIEVADHFLYPEHSRISRACVGAALRPALAEQSSAISAFPSSVIPSAVDKPYRAPLDKSEGVVKA